MSVAIVKYHKSVCDRLSIGQQMRLRLMRGLGCVTRGLPVEYAHPNVTPHRYTTRNARISC